MRMQFAFLAKYGETLNDGTFCAMGGGIHWIVVPAFPVLAPLTVIAHVVMTQADRGAPHWFSLEMYGPDGSRMPGEGRVNLENVRQLEGPFRDEESTQTVIFNVPLFPMTGPGHYRFRIVSDQGTLAPDLELGVAHEVEKVEAGHA